MVGEAVGERQASFVHQRHGAQADHGLGDGADALAQVRILPPAALDVSEAETLGIHEAVAGNDADGDAWHAQPVYLFRHNGAHPRPILGAESSTHDASRE